MRLMLCFVSPVRSAHRRKSVRWLINNGHDCQSFPSGETGCTDHKSAAISELVSSGWCSGGAAFRSDWGRLSAADLSDSGPAVGSGQ